jgi:hypothetical protein
MSSARQQLEELRKNLRETEKGMGRGSSAVADAVQITIVIVQDMTNVIEAVLAELDEHKAKLEHLPGKE